MLKQVEEIDRVDTEEEGDSSSTARAMVEKIRKSHPHLAVAELAKKLVPLLKADEGLLDYIAYVAARTLLFEYDKIDRRGSHGESKQTTSLREADTVTDLKLLRAVNGNGKGHTNGAASFLKTYPYSNAEGISLADSVGDDLVVKGRGILKSGTGQVRQGAFFIALGERAGKRRIREVWSDAEAKRLHDEIDGRMKKLFADEGIGLKRKYRVAGKR